VGQPRLVEWIAGFGATLSGIGANPGMGTANSSACCLWGNWLWDWNGSAAQFISTPCGNLRASGAELSASWAWLVETIQADYAPAGWKLFSLRWNINIPSSATRDKRGWFGSVNQGWLAAWFNFAIAWWFPSTIFQGQSKLVLAAELWVAKYLNSPETRTLVKAKLLLITLSQLFILNSLWWWRYFWWRLYLTWGITNVVASLVLLWVGTSTTIMQSNMILNFPVLMQRKQQPSTRSENWTCLQRPATNSGNLWKVKTCYIHYTPRTHYPGTAKSCSSSKLDWQIQPNFEVVKISNKLSDFQR